MRQEVHSFYKDVVMLLHQHELPFMVGGGFAMHHYTGIVRDTKDLDIFCKPGEYAPILKLLADHGYVTELTDARWLAKVFKDHRFMDIIFNTTNNICTVDDSWYEHAVEGEFGGIPVRMLPPVELIWCKIYVQNRERFDGADVNHLLLHTGKHLDWERLLRRIDAHWHLLLSAILLFQFVYPSEYPEIIPRWLFDELMQRALQQYDVPSSLEKVCRGPLIDQTQYASDIVEEHYKVTTIKTI
ncbi:MAG TPA: hypothetical protein VL832_29545 [Puia sp.]|jgi:hypothetical protein|nr:hypothetical protein [Puia sp.]